MISTAGAPAGAFSLEAGIDGALVLRDALSLVDGSQVVNVTFTAPPGAVFDRVTLVSGAGFYAFNIYDVSTTPAVVPVPAAGGLLALGLATLLARRRRLDYPKVRLT